MDKLVFGRMTPILSPFVGVIQGLNRAGVNVRCRSLHVSKRRTQTRRGKNLCNSKDGNYSIDAKNAHVLDMPSNIIPLKSLCVPFAKR